MAKENLQYVETLRRMKLGRHKSTKGKRAKDTMTPPASNDSPISPDQGVNVDNSVRDGSPHQMVGDVVVLASTFTHIAKITSSPNIKSRVKMMVNKTRLVKRTYKYKSPFVERCAKQFERITRPQKLVVDYAFNLNGNEMYFKSYIECCNYF